MSCLLQTLSPVELFWTGTRATEPIKRDWCTLGYGTYRYEHLEPFLANLHYEIRKYLFSKSTGTQMTYFVSKMFSLRKISKPYLKETAQTINNFQQSQEPEEHCWVEVWSPPEWAAWPRRRGRAAGWSPAPQMRATQSPPKKDKRVIFLIVVDFDSKLSDIPYWHMT